MKADRIVDCCSQCERSYVLKMSFTDGDVRVPMFYASESHATCELALENARCFFHKEVGDVPLWTLLNQLGANLGNPPWNAESSSGFSRRSKNPARDMHIISRPKPPKRSGSQSERRASLPRSPSGRKSSQPRAELPRQSRGGSQGAPLRETPKPPNRTAISRPDSMPVRDRPEKKGRGGRKHDRWRYHNWRSEEESAPKPLVPRLDFETKESIDSSNYSPIEREDLPEPPPPVKMFPGLDRHLKVETPEDAAPALPDNSVPAVWVWCGTEADFEQCALVQGRGKLRQLKRIGAFRTKVIDVSDEPSGFELMPISASPSGKVPKADALGLPRRIERLEEPAPGAMLRPADLRDGAGPFGIIGLSQAKFVRQICTDWVPNPLPREVGVDAGSTRVERVVTHVQIPGTEEFRRVWMTNDDPKIWVTQSDVMRAFLKLADRRFTHTAEIHEKARARNERTRNFLLGVFLQDYDEPVEAADQIELAVLSESADSGATDSAQA